MSEAKEQAKERLLKKKAAYQAFFNTPNGKIILEDLNLAFGQSTLRKGSQGCDPYASIAAAGSREVVLYIEYMLKESDSNASA